MRKCRCGSSELEAKGKCKRCYLKDYRESPDNIKQIKECKALWYQANKDLNAMKLKREQIFFDGKREQVLQRDNFECTLCSSLKKLVVHHKDGRGRGIQIPNNSIDNLLTLCKACHLEIHRKEIMLAKRLRSNGFWSKTHKQCTECKTTRMPHNARGYCRSCYVRLRRSHKI